MFYIISKIKNTLIETWVVSTHLLPGTASLTWLLSIVFVIGFRDTKNKNWNATIFFLHYFASLYQKSQTKVLNTLAYTKELVPQSIAINRFLLFIFKKGRDVQTCTFWAKQTLSERYCVLRFFYRFEREWSGQHT